MHHFNYHITESIFSSNIATVYKEEDDRFGKMIDLVRESYLTLRHNKNP